MLFREGEFFQNSLHLLLLSSKRKGCESLARELGAL